MYLLYIFFGEDLTEENENRKRLQQMAVFMTLPFVMAVPPAIGWLIGWWLDKRWDTTYLAYVFVFFGVIAGIRETYRIIKRFGSGI